MTTHADSLRVELTTKEALFLSWLGIQPIQRSAHVIQAKPKIFAVRSSFEGGHGVGGPFRFPKRIVATGMLEHNDEKTTPGPMVTDILACLARATQAMAEENDRRWC